MKKVGVIILNYLNYTDTIECVESLKDDLYKDKEIVVVDNGSNNESYQLLQSKYKDSNNIHVISTNQNLGFARGNNFGIVFARKELNCDNILLVNNDTLFKDNMMITELINACGKNVGVIGPRILSRDNKEQNPVPNIIEKEKVIRDFKYLNSLKFKIKSTDFYSKSKIIGNLLKIKNSILKIDVNKINEIKLENNSSVDLILHGACMLLTEEYFKWYPYLFPETFLYYEENILTLLTQKVGLEKKFIDNAWIYHKEDQSSEMSFKNSNKVKIKYELESMKQFLDIFDMSYEEIRQRFFVM